MFTEQQRLAGLSADSVRRTKLIEDLAKRGQLDAAEREATFALVLAPDHPEILRVHGMVQFLKQNYDEAITALIKARERQPSDPLIYKGLGSAYEAIMDHTKALEAFRQACDFGSDLASCWFNYGKLLFVSGDSAAALEMFERALKLAPQYSYARIMLANILSADGRFAEAESEFRKVISSDPLAGQAWWGLATLKPMPLDKADIAKMKKAFATPGTDRPHDRYAIGFALANAMESHGDYAGALQVFDRAHRTARRHEPFDKQAFDKRVSEILVAFKSVGNQASIEQGKEVIFITSLPRSGSTLIEQILASHSQVEGAAELPNLPQIIIEESNRLNQSLSEWAPSRTSADWADMGQRYLAKTTHWRRAKPRFTDKLPGNWLHIGAILAMLPQAKVVIVRRDPLETCLGCYRYLFTGLSYTHDFSDLANFWRNFDRAANFWTDRYPGRVFELSYENLQADQEAQTRALLSFCELPFEEACLNFHQTERRVTTPSSSQVREALRRDTARAAKFGALLDPLRRELGIPDFEP